MSLAELYVAESREPGQKRLQILRLFTFLFVSLLFFSFILLHASFSLYIYAKKQWVQGVYMCSLIVMFLIKLQGNKCCTVIEHTINVYYFCIDVCCLKQFHRIERKNKYNEYKESKREDEVLSQTTQLPCLKGRRATSLDAFLLQGVKEKSNRSKAFFRLGFQHNRWKSALFTISLSQSSQFVALSTKVLLSHFLPLPHISQTSLFLTGYILETK